MNQIMKDLVAARKLIESPNNWIQLNGGFVGKGPGVCYCLANAVYAACNYDVTRQRNALNAMGFSSLHDTWLWNDDKTRTHGNVIEQLDAGIYFAENSEIQPTG